LKTVKTAFAHVDTWVFDLDNTLYPPHADLWPKIDERITSYIATRFALDRVAARAMQKAYYHEYGTSLSGLMQRHSVDPHEFLDFVHKIDRSSLLPNHALGAVLAALPGRKLVFTNGSHYHAHETASALDIIHHFDGIFDIVAAELVPKPHAVTYERFFKKHDVNPKSAAMFEDIVKNLTVPHAVGMKTVLVIPQTGAVDHRDEGDRSLGSEEDLKNPEVDFVTADLTAFLNTLV